MASMTSVLSDRAVDVPEGALSTLIQGLNPEQASQVVRSFRVRVFVSGVVIQQQDEYQDFVYIVKSGKARVTRRVSRGQESTLLVVGAGDFFGLESLFSDRSGKNVVALEELTALYSPRETLLFLMETIPQLASNVVRLLSSRASMLEDRIVSFTGGALQRRLVLALLKLSEDGEKSSDGVKVPGTVTHEFLSSIVGASREAVTIALGKLKEAGAIQQLGKGNLVVKTEILLRLSEGE